LAHLLCEIVVRLKEADMPVAAEYELPMTQEQIGDALGLTSVHVNHVLKVLQENGLIVRDQRQMKVANWSGLRVLADFNDRYLHLNQC
jgi:DNA-binding MarR family transcriptional regulator